MAALPATETIAAIATAQGLGGIGIIRISGPEALSLLRRVFVPRSSQCRYTSHMLYYGQVIDRQGQILDEALAVYMQAPRTYTREDVVELHCHGSFLALQSVLRTVLEWGCRLADPGEFTQRAFLAGRIDLTRAEAVLDLLQAQTEAGARLAAQQLQGALYHRIEAIRQHLIGFLAVLEVAIDFPDDEVEIFDTAQAQPQLHSTVVEPLTRLLALADRGKMVREGVKVVIVGRPNVGKSSLLNALLREERALVTAIPGTTRDTIEERIAIHGIPIHLVDTAGIRAHHDPVEALGIERAQQKLGEADLVLFVVDSHSGMEERDWEIYHQVRPKLHLVVANKGDLATAAQQTALGQALAMARVVTISARDRQGLETLEEAIYGLLTADQGELTEQLTCAPNTRHRAILVRALEACERFGSAMAAGAPVDLLAIEVQTALDALGDITGSTTPEEVLDAVFSRFCLGK